MTGENRPRVVIVGAGFGGLWAAKAFGGAPVDVTVVDRNNYHSFFPLLYQVAAAELEPEDIIYPVRSVLHRYPNIHFELGEVTGIDTTLKVVITGEKKLPYDYLILSVGSRPHFFGVQGASEYTFPMRNLEEAVSLRNHILYRFETAVQEADPSRREELLTFVIVGGGPTGVEFAGALAELVRRPLVRDYPSIDMSQVHILLLEATDHLLTVMPHKLQKYSLNRLRQLGVDVQLNSPVIEVNKQQVVLKDGRSIPTETVVWTAGVGGLGLPQGLDVPTRANGQVEVLPSLQVPGHPEIYIIGDLAYVKQGGEPLLLVATVATQEGEWASRNIIRQAAGKPAQPFHYHDLGIMAVTGRNAAAARIWRFTLTGFPAWFIWLTIHIYRLIGFRNKMLVLINWAWDYIFFDRVVRLIFPLPQTKTAEQGC
jgi:NADH dehydrogenase